MCRDRSQTWLQITDHVGVENIQFGCHRSALISDLKLAPVGHQEHLGNPPQASYRPLWRQTKSTGILHVNYSFCFKCTVLVAKIRNMYIQLEAGGDILRLKWYKIWLWSRHWPLPRMLTPGVRMTQEASDPRFGIHLVCITHSVHFSYRTHSSYRTHFSYSVHFS